MFQQVNKIDSTYQNVGFLLNLEQILRGSKHALDI